MNQNTKTAGDRPTDDATTGSDRAAVSIGEDVQIDDMTIVGYRYGADPGKTVIGDEAVVRAGTVVYADVVLEAGCMTGHDVLIREESHVGERTLVGSYSVLDGRLSVGTEANIQTGVYVPPGTEIEDRVFLGPRAVLTNDPYPLRVSTDLVGPTIRRDATVGANATVLPDLTIGEGAFVAAGAVVTDDVPPWTLAVGVPAAHRPLPDRLRRQNQSP